MCLNMPKSIEDADVGPLEVHTAGVILSFSSSKAMLKELPSFYRQTDSLYRNQAKQFDVWLPMQPATGEYITGCGEGDGTYADVGSRHLRRAEGKAPCINATGSHIQQILAEPACGESR